MQENVAKLIIISTVFIGIVITILILFNKELTPFFDFTDIFSNLYKDFSLPELKPKDFDS